MRKKLVRLAAVLLAGLMVWGTVDITALQVQAEEYGDNVILNPDFTDADLSVWSAGQGSATISAVNGEKEIFDGVTTYAVISSRTSPYECIAQDITQLVENGKEYKYSFYAKLSGDYEGAPADQRELNFAPYVTVDGATSYLGSYSAELTGNCTQVLTPGEWTYFEGTFKIDYTGNIDQIVIRLLEQGSNYGQGECVKGEYYIAGVSMQEIIKNPIVLEDVVPVKDAVTEVMGDDFIVGGAVSTTEIMDMGCVAIAKKHFNALSIGNELKPDALFGYSNGKCPGTTTDELNGETIVVPVMDFSRAEKILNKIKKWNEEDPENPIKVRGHVLVWHAQTPEWFFHVDYDASKDYVSKEEMDKRLEWYIKTVLEHFTGEDSPYKGMFYGWDVVNEAVSDSGRGYRRDNEKASESLSEPTHGSNSSWWHVYQSEEYIMNAFIYANKYAPADVELYYNDYNEFNMTKMKGILELLNAVKSTEGARLDGMGMQGHYSVSDPDTYKFETALKSYAEAAGSVQITEWDIKASGAYNGTEESKQTENIRIANRYKTFYNSILALKESGVNITGITFWGIVDKYSWLQTSSSVGGGADGSQTQFPLLFDDDYKVKPAYWAFVDQSLVETNGVVVEVPEESEVVTEEKEPKAEVETEVKTEPESEPETETAKEQETSVEEAPEDMPEEKSDNTMFIILLAVVACLAAGVSASVAIKKKNKK